MAIGHTGGGSASIAVHEQKVAGSIPCPSDLVCADCGAPAHHYDHRDYNRPLDIEPVCRSCNYKRGPAIPRQGAFRETVERGFAPYTRRSYVRRIFAAMGADAAFLGDMPPRLGHEHWVQILPEFEAAYAAYCG